jgi:hypothetical protein
MTPILQCQPARFAAAVLLAAAAVLAPLSTTSAQPAPTFAQVLEGAKKEGALIVWASSPGEQKTYRRCSTPSTSGSDSASRPNFSASTPPVDAAG